MKTIIALVALMLCGCATPHLETRVYRVGEIFWKSITPDVANYQTTDSNDSAHLQEFLERAHFPFPDGAFIEVNRAKSLVTIRNEPGTIDKMERAMGPMDGSGVFYEERLR